MKIFFPILSILTAGLLFSTTAPASTLIQPTDLEYLGTFRLPDVNGSCDWTYSGHAMTYYPDGDPKGIDDGHPGSLFVTGNDAVCQHVAEISIPKPVISKQKQLSELPTAKMLQPFSDIRSDIFGPHEDLVLPRAGLAYLPAQGTQKKGKLYFTWGQHIQDFDPSHGWSEVDLSKPNTAGPWYFGSWSNYVSNDYLFEIPASWADKHTPGLYLASGRSREGPWSGLGPALFAAAPWKDGNPPAAQKRLKQITPLLLYGEQVQGDSVIAADSSMKYRDYGDSDHWLGGAWLTAGSRSAVIFVGTKAIGKSWYGFPDGTRWAYDCAEQNPPTCPKLPPSPFDQRGYWADGHSAQIIFYDPADLAAVVRGEKKSWQPQPYAKLDLDQQLYDPFQPSKLKNFLQRYKRDLVISVAYDRQRGFLYIMERQADDEKGLVHVWALKGS